MKGFSDLAKFADLSAQRCNQLADTSLLFLQLRIAQCLSKYIDMYKRARWHMFDDGVDDDSASDSGSDRGDFKDPGLIMHQANEGI